MDDFKKTNPAGRSISMLFSNVGWGIAAIGLLFAVVGILLGAVPGSEGPSGPVTLTGRLGAAGLGVAIALFGLFSVMVAAQTRAALDTADMTRAMLKLARGGRSPVPLTARKDATGFAKIEEPQATPHPAPQRDEFPERAAVTPAEDVPAMPANLRPRIASPVSAGSPLASAPTKSKPRTEPPIVPVAKAPPANRPHPIFSAKPPR